MLALCQGVPGVLPESMSDTLLINWYIIWKSESREIKSSVFYFFTTPPLRTFYSTFMLEEQSHHGGHGILSSLVKAISALLRPSCQAAVLISRKSFTLAWESSGRMSLDTAHRIWHWQRKMALSVRGSLSFHYHEPICLLLFIHRLAFPMAFPDVSLATSMEFIGLYLQEKPLLPHMRTFGVS